MLSNDFLICFGKITPPKGAIAVSLPASYTVAYSVACTDIHSNVAQATTNAYDLQVSQFYLHVRYSGSYVAERSSWITAGY